MRFYLRTLTPVRFDCSADFQEPSLNCIAASMADRMKILRCCLNSDSKRADQNPVDSFSVDSKVKAI